MVWAIVAILFVILLAGFMIYQLQAANAALAAQTPGGILNKVLTGAGF
jgi:hypothetical protein